MMICHHSFICKAVVSTMFGAVQGRDPWLNVYPACVVGEGEEEEEEEEENKGKGGGDHTIASAAGPRDAIESAAGTCVLWCTVAVGCLVAGQPKSSVSPTGKTKRVLHCLFCSGGGGGDDSRMVWGHTTRGLVRLGVFEFVLHGAINSAPSPSSSLRR